MNGKAADGAMKGTAAMSLDFGRVAAGPENAAGIAINPLFAHPTVAVAAATAIAFGLTTQMAGAFLGALQGVMTASRQFADALERQAGEGAAVTSREAPAEPKAQEKPARKATAARGKADDLKRISGIGPKLETVLNDKGIFRFTDIAAWSDADVQCFDDEFGFGGRIIRDDWVGQAKALGKTGSVRK